MKQLNKKENARETGTVSDNQVKLKHRKADGFRFSSCTGAVAVPLTQDRLQVSFYADRADIEHELLTNDGAELKLSGDIKSTLVREHVVGLDMTLPVARDIYLMLKEIFESKH